VSGMRMFICLTDYSKTEEEVEVEDKKTPHQEIEDKLYSGGGYFLDFYYPTIGGIDDDNDPPNRYGGEE